MMYLFVLDLSVYIFTTTEVCVALELILSIIRLLRVNMW